MDETPEIRRLRRHTLLFGWSVVTLALLLIVLFAVAGVVLYLRYKHGLGG